MTHPQVEAAGSVCRTSHRVIFADTDAMGIVYYANYLKYFEIGRAEWFRRFVQPFTKFIEQDMYLIVVDSYCKYHWPARYDQVLQIDTRLAELRRSKCRFDYSILCEDGSKLLASGHTTHAIVGKDGRPRRFNKEFSAQLEAAAQLDKASA